MPITRSRASPSTSRRGTPTAGVLRPRSLVGAIEAVGRLIYSAG